MPHRKPEMLRIRCNKDTFKRFKYYAIPFKDYEEALNNALDKAEQVKEVEKSRPRLESGKIRA